MNPANLVIAAFLAVAGGLGGAWAVDKLVEKPKPPSPPPGKPETKTSGVRPLSMRSEISGVSVHRWKVGHTTAWTTSVRTRSTP